MKMRLLTLAVAAIALSACVDDITAANGRIADPTPQAGTFHTVFAENAINIANLDTVSTAPNGDFQITYSDGSTFSGNVNRATGAFDVKLLLPGFFNDEIDDTGTLALNGQGLITAADYVELRHYADGRQDTWDVHFDLAGAMLTVDARERTRGTRVHSVSRSTSNGLFIDETWTLAATFEEQVSTRYSIGSVNIAQQWTRDDLATDASPDRTASFTIYQDGSGDGTLVWNYDHGITQKFGLVLNTDGSYTETLVFEDPGTTVSPDGQGTFAINASYAGNGNYVERYDDGSRLDIAETYNLNGSERDDFTFDDASTTFAPDLDGHNVYQYDRSGNGEYHKHAADGSFETCDYDFDPAGTITNLVCVPTASP